MTSAGVTSDGTWLYVAGDDVIERFLIATGEHQGTIGAGTGTGDGQFEAVDGLYCDGTYLYAADSVNGRILKFVAATGDFEGWVGQIGSISPAKGGAPGCDGAHVGEATPGWCMGGAAQATVSTPIPGDGSLAVPLGVAGDGTYIFVADSSYSINRYHAATGSFAGWIGIVYDPPTAIDLCQGLSQGTPSPGWCMGGTYDESDASIVPNVVSVYSDGVNLYAGSMDMNVVNRYSAATGALTGWWGKVWLTPTDGDPHCTEAVRGDTTPGWCIGGDFDTGNGTTLGSVMSVFGISGFGPFIYISDGGGIRIVRVAK